MAAHQAPRLWDSPGKNTGVGCHFLLQCMKVKVKPCPTLSDPIDCSLPGSSVHGIFQARVLEWGAIAFSKTSGWLALITVVMPEASWRTKLLCKTCFLILMWYSTSDNPCSGLGCWVTKRPFYTYAVIVNMLLFIVDKGHTYCCIWKCLKM